MLRKGELLEKARVVDTPREKRASAQIQKARRCGYSIVPPLFALGQIVVDVKKMLYFLFFCVINS